jgi:hypothetical protein
VKTRITWILFPVATFELYFTVKSAFSLGVRPPPRLHLPSSHGEAARVYVALAAREWEITEQTKRKSKHTHSKWSK